MLDHIIEHGDEIYTELNAATARLASSLNGWWGQQGLALRVDHYGSQFRIIVPPDVAMLFFQTLNLNGVYCWEGRTCFLYSTHTHGDVGRIIEAVQEGKGPPPIYSNRFPFWQVAVEKASSLIWQPPPFFGSSRLSPCCTTASLSQRWGRRTLLLRQRARRSSH